MIAKLLRVFATVWFVVVGLLIVVSIAMTWYMEGFGRVQEIFSPFNVINFIAMVVTLVPGVGASMLAERLESRRQATTDRRITP